MNEVARFYRVPVKQEAFGWGDRDHPHAVGYVLASAHDATVATLRAEIARLESALPSPGGEEVVVASGLYSDIRASVVTNDDRHALVFALDLRANPGIDVACGRFNCQEVEVVVRAAREEAL